MPFPERNPLKRCLQLVGGQKQQQKAFFGLFGFCSQVSFLYQKLWHFSSRLQREGRMLSPAHICSPGGSGCSPGPLHNYRHTKMDLLHLLLGLAAMFLLLRLYPRNTTFPDPKGTALESRGLFPPPSLYSILCFFLLPLGAFLLSCMGNADTSWGSPPTGGP